MSATRRRRWSGAWPALLGALALLAGCADDTTGPGLTWPPTEQPGFVRRIGAEDEGIARMGNLVVEPGGSVLVSDIGVPSRLLRFAADGRPAGTITPATSDSGYALDVLARGEDGHLWTTDARRERLVRLEADGSGRVAFGGPGFDPGQFALIVDVAVGPMGDLYVLDRANPRVTVFSAEGRYLRHWSGGCLEGCGFDQPIALAVDAGGTVYVCDDGLRSVFRFDSSGHWLGTWDGTGLTGLYGFHPQDVAVDPTGEIALFESYSSQVFYFTPAGAFLRRVTLSGARVRSYPSPGLAILPGGDLLAAAGDDVGGVLRVDGGGHLVMRFGHARGVRPGTLGSAALLAVDERRHVFVYSRDRDDVQEFAPDGSVVQAWGDPSGVSLSDIAVDAAGNLNRLSAYTAVLYRTPLAGGETAALPLAMPDDANSPTALAVARDGRLFVGTQEGFIHVYEADGRPITSWPVGPIVNGRSDPVADLVLDARDRLWVLDPYRYRVTAFNVAGQEVGGFDAPTDAHGYRVYLDRIALDPAGDLTALVSAESGEYVYVFSAAGAVLVRWNFGVLETGFTCNPADLAWDDQGRLYLADAADDCGGVNVYGP